jgi:hypothetical protein
MDAQSVKTVEASARRSGYDGYKRIKGRKRHLLVDTLGVQPRRWAVERSFAWLVRNRRRRTDYERRRQTSATLIAVAFVRLLRRRLARRG